MNTRGRLDFDGVIADFYTAVRNFYGLEHPKRQILDGKSYLLDDVIGRRPIDALMSSIDFWANMPPFPWALYLIESVDEIFKGNWCFVTKGQANPSCAYGKLQWLLKNFPQYVDKLNLTFGKNKNDFCGGEGDVLIDDWLPQIKSWRQCGGTGFFWSQITADYNETPIIDERILSLKRVVCRLNEK